MLQATPGIEDKRTDGMLCKVALKAECWSVCGLAQLAELLRLLPPLPALLQIFKGRYVSN